MQTIKGEAGGGKTAHREHAPLNAAPHPKGTMYMTKVLFVCMGNICRSPTAQGVFRKMVAEAGLESSVQVESAGTHSYHVGEPPDARALQAAKRRGVEIGDLRARQVTQDDFRDFDLILAMDWENLALLHQQ